MSEEPCSVYAATRISETLFAKLEEITKREKRSNSAIIRDALEEYVKQRN